MTERAHIDEVVTIERLVHAIKSLTTHVRRHEKCLIWDTNSTPTQVEEDTRVTEVRNSCSDIERFAELSKIERTTFRQFNIILHENSDVRLGIPVGMITEIADAFAALDRLD